MLIVVIGAFLLVFGIPLVFGILRSPVMWSIVGGILAIYFVCQGIANFNLSYVGATVLVLGGISTATGLTYYYFGDAIGNIGDAIEEKINQIMS